MKTYQSVYNYNMACICRQDELRHRSVYTSFLSLVQLR
jgi:hypothetical protein